MKKETSKPIYSASIRQRAEEKLKQRSSTTAGRLTEAESHKLLYELQVHQVELEMQNEALQVAMEKTAAAIALYDFAPSGYLTLNSKGIILELNRAGTRLLGKESSTLLYCNLFQFVTEDTQSLLIDFLAKIFASGSRQTCEIRLIHHGIPSNYVLLEGILFDNEPKCLVTMVDMTERKAADHTLLKSELRHKKMIENIGDVISIIGSDGTIKYTSPNVEKVLGWKPEEVIGKMNIWNLVHPDDLEAINKAFFALFEKESVARTMESRIKSANGIYKWMRITGINRLNDDSIAGILVNYHDISERKQAEEELLAQKRFFEQVFSQSSVSTQILDKEGWCERINPKLTELFGVKPADIEGKLYNIFLDDSVRHGGILPYLDKVFIEHKTAEWDIYFDIGLSAESQHIEVADKKKVWFHNWAYPVLDEEGRLINVIIQHTDITEGKKAEEAQRNSEIRLHTLIQTIPDLIWLKDRDGVYLTCNRMFERFFGAREIEIAGKTDYDFVDRELADFFRENDCKAMNEGKSLSNEEWVTFADDGHRALLDTIKTPMYDAAGMIIGVLGISHDITERKKAEEALKKTEVRFRSYFELPIVGIAITSPTADWIEVNDKLCEMLGYTREELHQTNWCALTHPEDLSIDLAKSNQVLSGEIEGYSIDKRFICKNGEHLWISLSVRCVRKEDALVDYFVALMLDISKSKLAEEALKESEERYRSIFENASIGIYRTLPNGQILLANTALVRMLGYGSFEELATRNLEKEGFGRDYRRSDFREQIERDGEIRNVELSLKRKDNSDFYVRENARVFRDNKGKVLYYEGTIEDISERKKAEDKLKLFLFGIESGYDGIIISDMKGSISYANTSAEMIFGYQRDELLAMNVQSLNFDPLNAQRMLSEIIINGKWSGETQSVKKNGELFPNVLSISVIKGNDGKPIAIMGIFRDITEKKEVAKRVNLLARSLESINECVSITDLNDIILYINESLLQTYDYRKEELIGKHISILSPFENGNKPLSDIRQHTKEGGWKGEIINKRKDGTLFPILLSTSVINDENENSIALIGVARDITELKSNREELIAAKENAEESNRLKSAFLANMSHEIRTPMNAIIGFSDLMLDAEPEERIHYAGIVQKSSKQLLMLIDDVIQMSRLQSEKLPLNIVVFKPSELVSDVYHMLNLPDFKKGIDLMFNIPTQHNNLTVRSDKDKIRQVLTNLVSNALRYTFNGSVELGFVLHSGDIEFYVKDTGIGIPEDEQQQIFETFYRGKQAISSAIGGTGLGLKIAKELVELMGGQIGVNSEQGKGARFFFRIPVE